MNETGVRRQGEELGRQVAGFCDRLDPDTVRLADVPAVFDALVAMSKCIDGAVVRMTARYTQAGAWRHGGAKDADDDVARKTGTTKSAARKRRETSTRLRDLARTDEAVRAGELSAEQAAAVASGAAASPADEQALLDAARREPLAAVERKAAEARASADTDPAARYRRQHALRCVKRWLDDDGLYNLLLKTTPELGAEIDARLKTAIDRAIADARDTSRADKYEAIAADVVTDILSGRGTHLPADHPNAHSPDSQATPADPTLWDDKPEPSPTTTTTGPATPGATADAASAADAAGAAGAGADGAAGAGAGADSGVVGGPVPEPRNGHGPGRAAKRQANQAVRPDRKVIALVDLAALNRGHTVAGETCHIAGIGPVPAPVIRSMLSDAFVALVIKNGKDVLNVTHLGRQVTAHQRTALEARGYRCEVDGCGVTHHLDIDHVTGWALTNETRLEDLAWLCRHHHRRKTAERLILTGPPGRRRLSHPDHATREPAKARAG